MVIEEIKQNVDNQPYAKWFAAMDESAYKPPSSYSWNTYGSVEDVAGVTMEDAKSFFDKFYSPDNAVLCIAGDCTPEDGFAKAEEYFGSIAGSSNKIVRPNTTPENFKIDVHTVVPDSVAVPAVYIAIHTPGVTEDAVLDADLAASFMGAGKSSLLYKRLVSDKRIASHAGTFMDRKVNGSLLIMWAYAIDATVSAQDLTDAMYEVMQGADLSENDMEKIVNRQKTALAMELQRTSGVADSMGYHATFKGDPNEVNRLIEKYSSRNRADVTKFVRQAAKRDQWVRVDIVPQV